MNATCPAKRSLTAGGPLLYGTCTTSMSASDLNSSPDRCGVLPTPPDLKLSKTTLAQLVEAVRADPRYAELRAHIWHELKAARPARAA